MRTPLYKAAPYVAAFALLCGVAGALASPTHANAEQEALRRGLNARGHLEVQVNGKDYELYGKSQASDDSIRHQALIQEINNFNITSAYPELENMNTQGNVVQVRSVNEKDNDCVFYVERRLEPALNKVVDANAGCIRHDDTSRYLNRNIEAISKPELKKGQTFYMTYAHVKNSNQIAGVIFLLDGNADDYVAINNDQKLAPKGQSGETQRCGIDMQDICPQVASVDVFTNAKGHLAAGEIGGSIAGDSLNPPAGASMAQLFGTILHMDDQQLQLETPSGKHVTITWPKNYVEEFNAKEAANPSSSSKPWNITEGDHLVVTVNYKEGADTTQFSISNVASISLALKSPLPDPLSGKTYSKQEAMQNLVKY